MNKELKYITTAAFVVGMNATVLCIEATGSPRAYKTDGADPYIFTDHKLETKSVLNKNILHGILTVETPKIEVGFMGMVQKFAETQTELDSEFLKILNNLTLKAGKRDFKKKRF